MGKFKIYASDTRKSDKAFKVKECDDYFEAREFFINTVWKFKCKKHPGLITENTTSRFTFEFESGEMVDLIMLIDN